MGKAGRIVSDAEISNAIESMGLCIESLTALRNHMTSNELHEIEIGWTDNTDTMITHMVGLAGESVTAVIESKKKLAGLKTKFDEARAKKAKNNLPPSQKQKRGRPPKKKGA